MPASDFFKHLISSRNCTNHQTWIFLGIPTPPPIPCFSAPVSGFRSKSHTPLYLFRERLRLHISHVLRSCDTDCWDECLAGSLRFYIHFIIKDKLDCSNLVFLVK